MGTKYVTEAISGYNSSPPADDGSTAASNQVKWSTIKSKLPDPLKTAIESINSKLVTALDFSARSVTSADSTVAGDHMRTLEVPSTVTATFTISLGDAATMANGYIVRLRNSSAVDITVGRVTSGDTIDGAASNKTLYAGTSATFAVNAAGSGYYTVSDVTPSASDTAAGRIEIAIQSEMESASSTALAVTPGRLQYHPQVPKIWGYITVTAGTPALSTGYGVSSVDDLGVGNYRINFGTSMSSVNYAAICTAVDAAGGDSTTVNVTTQNAGSITVQCHKQSSGPAAVDPAAISVVCMGDFA